MGRIQIPAENTGTQRFEHPLGGVGDLLFGLWRALSFIFRPMVFAVRREVVDMFTFRNSYRQEDTEEEDPLLALWQQTVSCCRELRDWCANGPERLRSLVRDTEWRRGVDEELCGWLLFFLVVGMLGIIVQIPLHTFAHNDARKHLGIQWKVLSDDRGDLSLFVMQVRRGKPVHRAGVRIGDEIPMSPDDFYRAVSSDSLDIRLPVIRNGKQISLYMTNPANTWLRLSEDVYRFTAKALALPNDSGRLKVRQTEDCYYVLYQQ